MKERNYIRFALIILLELFIIQICWYFYVFYKGYSNINLEFTIARLVIIITALIAERIAKNNRIG